MFAYYVDLARRSLARNVGLTVLMIAAIAFGVGASMTTLTVLHVLAQDPIPQKSHALYNVQLEPRKLLGFQPGQAPPDQLTRLDAEALLRAGKAEHQAIMTGGNAAIEPGRKDLPPFNVLARWTSADFFKMFDAPFVTGGAWSEDEDQHAARVVVIARELADKVFGSVDAVGKTIRIEGTDMRVIGVLDTWRVQPHFWDIYTGAFGKFELVYAPWSTSRELKLGHDGSMDCWDENSDSQALGAPCVWVQFWVELHGDDRVAAYQAYLEHYSEEQKRVGRYERPVNAKLLDVMGWLEHMKVVPNDARLQTWIALGFLLVCLINTVGLLLTKFLRRSAEIGVRRALGASKRAIFVQLLVEAGAIGVVGGVLGLGLAWLGLLAVRHQPTAYAQLAQLDLPMLAATFGLAILTSLLAGLLPAWRGCQVTPAIQLKSH